MSIKEFILLWAWGQLLYALHAPVSKLTIGTYKKKVKKNQNHQNKSRSEKVNVWACYNGIYCILSREGDENMVTFYLVILYPVALYPVPNTIVPNGLEALLVFWGVFVLFFHGPYRNSHGKFIFWYLLQKRKSILHFTQSTNKVHRKPCQ